MFLRVGVGCVLLAVLAGCQGAGGDPLVGKYQMSGGDAVFGPGADKNSSLELKGDKSFEVMIAGFKAGSGTWAVEGTTLKLEGQGSFTPSYRVDGSKLIPIKPDGTEVTSWSFVK